MSITRFFPYALCLLTLAAGDVGFAETARVVCIASNGTLSVRENKCLSSESKASMTNLPQRGPKGATGAVGQSALVGLRFEQVLDYQLMANADARTYVFAFCNDDEVVLGGGCACISGTCNSVLASTGPMPVETSTVGRGGWRCSMNPTSGTPVEFSTYGAYAVCAQAN